MSSSKKKWSLYLVRSRNGSLYTGITTNVDRRFNEHQNDPVRGAKSLRGKGPLSLVFQEEVGDKSRASALEYRLKKLPRHKKDAIVDGQLLLSEI
jgi:putative endonuclease